ncbi:DotU family type IV/VI secretion system protein [Deferribacter abyssi]|uniref:DotU family type IV/VI secretion system protein n=1 Tax=Deferribacter abyssi TaxID=213806 RepID=UPI003C19EFA0
MKLVDCFCEIIAYTLYFCQDEQKDNISSEELSRIYTDLVLRSQELARKNGFEKVWEDAFFPVCALVDELIMTSNWKHKKEWSNKRLQIKYFHTANAGEEFFEKLKSEGNILKDVKEVYLYCLSLGFKGKYYADEEKLEELVSKNIQDILDNTELVIPKELFPEAYEPDHISKKRGKRKWRFVSPVYFFVALIPILLLGGLYYFYKYKLDMMLNEYFK